MSNEATESKQPPTQQVGTSVLLSADVDCAALSAGRTCCTNGFPVTGGCYGRIKGGKPMCMREEWCGRVYNRNGGKPIQTECR